MRATRLENQVTSNSAPPDRTSGAGAPPSLLRVDGVSKSYGEVRALSDVSFALRAGEIVGLVGPNGAGKTTLLESIQGLHAFDVGFITLFDQDVRHGLTGSVKQRIGVAPQFFTLPSTLTVIEIAAMYQVLYRNAQSPEAVLRKVGLTEQHRVRFGRLSGGQKRRLALALALIGDAELLFLDEPTGDLDPQSRRFIWDVILDVERQRQRGVLVATHQMDEVEALCNRVIILDAGRILEDDTPQGLIARHCPGHNIRFATSRAQGARLAAQVPELRLTPHPTDPQRCGASLATLDLNATLTRLLALREQDDGAIENLQVNRNTLEDVFIQLTGKALRD